MRLHPLPVIALFTTLSFFTAADALHERAQRCPISCDSSIPSQWTSYHDPAYLSVCNETMLMYLAVYNPLEDPKTHSTIFACSTAETRAFEFGWTGSADESAIDQTLAIGDAFQRYFNNSVNCDHNDLFAQAGRVAVGIHINSHLEHSSASAAATQQLTSIIKSANGVLNQTVLQVCDSGSEWTLGVSVNTQGDLTSLQKHMRTWNDGKCVDDVASKKKINLSAIRNSTALEARALHTYHRRSTCSYVQVVSGDSCASLVQECGITTAEFTKYNPASDLCSTLAVGQYVCCSEGDLPDFSPKPYSNGTCYTYTVQSGDYCSALASSYSITVDDIEDFNSLTWGWMGCNDLQAGQTICLSDGEPPFPAPISNAVCGPQVPGTAQPTGDDDSPWFWAALNPCPLNACCDIWGQCGITPDYCTPSESPTGAPGTAAAGTNGCIDSCGTEMINDADGPDVFMAVGYYEGYNYNRDCLYMAASSIDTSKYTHIHYAFGKISSSYEVSVSDDEGTFSDFQKPPDVKKIIFFGGWDFSTDPSTYSIFRQGVTSANRESLANNVVDFVTNNNLDGVDFDWEYPGAPDIPGIPAGSDDEGDNYLEFLKLVRNGLPSDKTLSIAAPASYWYLQVFPISNISTVVDYIIYMTYDLHGQWDYGSTWAQDGCPAGNCLRSHVNLTETVLSLAMITKAGVATKQVVVGVTSYGRGFEMTDSDCTGPMCTFTGPDSCQDRYEQIHT
ncbi:glycoside hydrolase superfamily [Aspergillus desertorum]